MQKIENLKDSFVKVYDYVIQGRLGFSEVIKNKYFNFILEMSTTAKYSILKRDLCKKDEI